jgi:hypothetical protein
VGAIRWWEVQYLCETKLDAASAGWRGAQPGKWLGKRNGRDPDTQSIWWCTLCTALEPLLSATGHCLGARRKRPSQL